MLLEPVDPNERFRSRRRQARMRRAYRRIGLLAVVAVMAAGVTLGARFLSEPGTKPPTAAGKLKSVASPAPKPTPKPQPTLLPTELRGVHVTMALASLRGKLDEYLGLVGEGLNAIELDVKDENGDVAFLRPRVPLAQATGAAHPYYNPYEVVRKARAHGVYLIGRIVVFEDPILTSKHPAMAIRTSHGGVGKTGA